ncbi:MAG: hypothetical protein KOO63_12455, partial [Bacteroidales bacterium]|nr:hypothetical protein [Candidatus Latescibacterota bacterium]
MYLANYMHGKKDKPGFPVDRQKKGPDKSGPSRHHTFRIVLSEQYHLFGALELARFDFVEVYSTCYTRT